MTLKMFLILLLITMFGGSQQAKKPIGAPIVLSHVLEDLKDKSTCHISYFGPASSDHDQAEVFFEVSRHANQTEAVLIRPGRHGLNGSATTLGPGHGDLASWLHFLEVQTIEIYPARIPKDFRWSIEICCSNF